MLNGRTVFTMAPRWVPVSRRNEWAGYRIPYPARFDDEAI
ncbi:hypothetical protein DESC_610005 [Desulfosarcina cetonica]|nr:hypothetical protein DESC_610005 [Desulfosarcina cetonica]